VVGKQLVIPRLTRIRRWDLGGISPISTLASRASQLKKTVAMYLEGWCLQHNWFSYAL